MAMCRGETTTTSYEFTINKKALEVDAQHTNIWFYMTLNNTSTTRKISDNWLLIDTDGIIKWLPKGENKEGKELLS